MALLGQVGGAEIEASDWSAADGPILALLVAAAAVWIWLGLGLAHGRQPVAYEERRPVPWRVVDVAAIFFVFMVVALIGGVAFASLYQIPSGTKIPDHLQAPAAAVVSLCELLVLALAIVVLGRQRGATLTDLGFSIARLPSDLTTGLIGFLAVATPVQVLYALMQPTKLHQFVESAYREPSQLWILGVLAVFVAPLIEEFFFRVLLQGSLERWQEHEQFPATAPWLFHWRAMPIVASALVFAAAHAEQWPAPVPLFVFALALGYLYRQTHRIWPSLVVHALLNASTFLQLWWAIHTGAPLH